MNTLPASEVKRRGVAAFDESLKNGPLHIIKNNRPQYVVLSEENYQLLLQKAHVTIAHSLWDLLESRPMGKRKKQAIDKQIKQERSSWK